MKQMEIRKNSTDVYTRFFNFSRTQLEEQKKTANKLGRLFKPKQVIVNGVAKVYTDIVLDKNNVRYTDAYVVTSGDIRGMKFTS